MAAFCPLPSPCMTMHLYTFYCILCVFVRSVMALWPLAYLYMTMRFISTQIYMYLCILMQPGLFKALCGSLVTIVNFLNLDSVINQIALALLFYLNKIQLYYSQYLFTIHNSQLKFKN